MIYSAKGLLGVLNNMPITITSNDINQWNLEDALSVQKVHYIFKEILDNYDVKEKDGRIFITDLQTTDLFCLKDDLSIHQIVFEDRYEDRKVPKAYLFKNLNSEDLMIDTADSYGYYLLKFESFKLIKYSSILVLKNMPSFR